MRNSCAGICAVALLSLLSIACGHKRTSVNTPPPPPLTRSESQPNADAQTQPKLPQPETGVEDKDAIHISPDAKPLLVQTGRASWYGAPYHNRAGSNGKVYDMYAMTAAHLTLPLGSIVRVTNTKTGSSALVRITDRGPFVDGRIIDLSLAAAKKVDIWRPGVAEVRLEVMETPTPLDAGGRWAVQIGGFNGEPPARKIADQLTRRYQTAKVICFNSPTGDWWVRVRVPSDDRKRAEGVAREAPVTEGSIFLVRLD